LVYAVVSRSYGTRNPDELRERLCPLYAVSNLEFPRSRARFNATLNHRKLESVGLSFARYGAPTKITLSNTDFFTQGFGIRGYGEAVADGKFFKIGGGKGGAAGPGANAVLDYRAGFEHLFLRIPPEVLNRKLSALVGIPISRALKLSGEYDPPTIAAQYRLLRFVISELDRSEDLPPSLWLAEFEQALLVAYLYTNLSNYTDLLVGKRLNVASRQVRQAMEHIEANWDQPITIETLASLTECSVRSLFGTFRKSLGCSPMAFVRQVRLMRANEILSRGSPETSVRLVATACGFSNLGHFAKSYFSKFGELPSETLKGAKG